MPSAALMTARCVSFLFAVVFQAEPPAPSRRGEPGHLLAAPLPGGAREARRSVGSARGGRAESGIDTPVAEEPRLKHAVCPPAGGSPLVGYTNKRPPKERWGSTGPDVMSNPTTKRATLLREKNTIEVATRTRIRKSRPGRASSKATTPPPFK